MAQCKKGARFAAPFFISVLNVFCFTGFAYGEAVKKEVPVEDVSPGIQVVPVEAFTTSNQPALAVSIHNSGTSSSQQTEWFYQLQALQQEVQNLRGLVEEQNHLIQTLKQQRLDDYVDLDRRIASLSQQAVPVASATQSTTQNSAAVLSSAVAPSMSGDEKTHYTEAYNLLKARQVERAIQAFEKHIENYPQGEYTANAYYWLGEVRLLQGDLEPAQTAFSTLIKTYPDSRKTPDAQFKLAKVYFQQDKKSQAKKLLTEVARGQGTAAALAATYLQENF